MEQEADKLIGSHICYRIYQQYTSKGVSKMINIKKTQNTMYNSNIKYNEGLDKRYNISQQRQQNYDPCNPHK